MGKSLILHTSMQYIVIYVVAMTIVSYLLSAKSHAMRSIYACMISHTIKQVNLPSEFKMSPAAIQLLGKGTDTPLPIVNTGAGAEVINVINIV
jgi:hypothetical protein